MYNNDRRSSRPSGGGWKGGGNRFGGDRDRGSFNRGGDDRGFGRDKPMFQATCAECNSACEVPFKPNGSKPVLCSNCFKRDGGSQAPRFGGDRDRKPSFNSGFAPKPSFDRPAPSSVNMDKLEEQLRGINTKLEAVLNALNGSKATPKKEVAPAKKEAAPAKAAPVKAAPAEKPVKAAKEKKAVKKKK